MQAAEEASDMENPAELLLIYLVVPLWFLAGVVDWFCHRRADISHTAGSFESVLHLLMFGEAGLGIVLCLFCEINSLVFLFLVLLFLCHEATALWDVRYATAHREVNYWEQHVHSFLEMMPLAAIVLLMCLHWPQARALVMLNPGAGDWGLHAKSLPLPAAYIAIFLIAALVLELVPYTYELWTGWRDYGFRAK
jgi:hypothetical protein